LPPNSSALNAAFVPQADFGPASLGVRPGAYVPVCVFVYTLHSRAANLRSNQGRQRPQKGDGFGVDAAIFALKFRERETLEAVERSRFLCPRNSNASLAVTLRPLQSLSRNNPKRRAQYTAFA
jgi:hypothetical protein